MAFWALRIHAQMGRTKPAPTLEQADMFENVINPSAEGRWNRVAPYLTMSSIAVIFFLALMVVVSSVRTGYYLTTQLPQEPTGAAPAALVQTTNQAPFGG
jgi:hypothetical protein